MSASDKDPVEQDDQGWGFHLKPEATPVERFDRMKGGLEMLASATSSLRQELQEAHKKREQAEQAVEAALDMVQGAVGRLAEARSQLAASKLLAAEVAAELESLEAATVRGIEGLPERAVVEELYVNALGASALVSRADDQPGKRAKDPKPRHRVWRVLREMAIIVVVAVVLSSLIRAFLVQAFYVPTSSMENTLRPGDRIVASKISTTVSGVSRGEIVVFADPGDWLPDQPEQADSWRRTVRESLTFLGVLPSDTGDDLVKRVIGIGGDRVACCDADGRIVVNGVPLDEDYIVGSTDQVRFDVTVPNGGIFVLGDNRANSLDSRYHLEENSGSVPLADVVGRVFLVIWPFENFALERIPAIFGNPALQ